MRSIITLFVLNLVISSAFSQQFSTQDPAYIEAVQAGEEALRSEQYATCIAYYKTAFEIKQTSYLSTMRAAACAHADEDTKLRDEYLDKAFEISPDGSRAVFTDYEEFRFLDDSPFAELVENRFLVAFPNYDAALASQLAAVRVSDQAQRSHMGIVGEAYGWDSPQMDSLWVLQNHSDSVNTVYITNLIDDIGYPGKSLVGDQSGTAFLVIQHADLPIQEKYLPILRQAAEEEELRWSSLALLIDRVEMRNDRPQIYGSQVQRDPETGEYYFAQIKDPHNIDQTRAEVGLGPIQQYADRWNFTFDPDQYLARYQQKD